MKQILMQIGLTAHESEVYLKLSEIGMTTAYQVAQETQIHKANVYAVLKKLTQRGLVTEKKLKGKLFYEANDPHLLIDLLDEKRDLMNSVIPKIRLLKKKDDSGTRLQVLKGAYALLQILENALALQKPIFVYGAPKDVYQLMAGRLNSFHEKRIKKKVKMYHIYHEESIERVEYLKKLSYTPIRLFPKLHSRVATFIYGDYVVLSIWEPPIKHIVIKDKDLAEAYLDYFWVIWKASKKI